MVDFTLCEAAGIAADQAPGLVRERWGFGGWAPHDEDAWADILAEADARSKRAFPSLCAIRKSATPAGMPNPDRVRIAGLAPSRGAVTRARRHLRNAGFSALVQVECSTDQDFVDDLARLARTAKRRRDAAVLVCHVSEADSTEDEAYAAFSRGALHGRGQTRVAGFCVRRHRRARHGFSFLGRTFRERAHRRGAHRHEDADIRRRRLQPGRGSRSQPRGRSRRSRRGQRVEVRSSSPRACARWRASGGSGRSRRACRAIASTTPTFPEYNAAVDVYEGL